MHRNPELARATQLMMVMTALALTMGSVQGAPTAPVRARTAYTAVTQRHRSIWAIEWARRHPAEEVAYLHSRQYRRVRLYSRSWRPRWVAGRLRRSTAQSRRASRSLPRYAAPLAISPSAPVSANQARPAAQADPGGGQFTLAEVRIPGSSSALTSSDSPTAAPSGLAPQTSQTTAATLAAPQTGAGQVTRVASSQIGQASEAAGVDGADPDVSLDFVGADINDVLKSLAMQTHTNIVAGTDVHGQVTVSLTHVTLDEALDMISKLSGFQYAKVGRTYVVGTQASIQNLTAGDTSAVPPTTAVISFLYSDPTDLLEAIKERYPNANVTPGKGSGNGGGGVLVVTGAAADVDAVRGLIADSEEALSRGIDASKTVVYNIKYMSANDLVTVITRLVPNVVVTPGPATGFALSAPTTADATAQSTSSGPTTTTGNGTVATTSGNQAAKATTYMLLLTGTDVDIKRALDILAEVDVQPAQIAYDAKITEINLNDTRQLGLNWDFSGATTRIGEMPDEGTANSTVPTLGRGGNVFKFGVIGRTPISSLVNVSLDALFSNSNTKVLADPNISAVDGQQAAVFIGDTIYYVSSIAQTATGPTVQTASVSVGIKLFVAGKVSNDGYVTVNLHPEVSTISSWLSVPGGGQLPQISNREATTTVRVKDGDYIAIGGLINEQDVKTIQKVPGLGDIPFFGSLFRNTQNTHQRDEIVIFVKVSIDKNAD